MVTTVAHWAALLFTVLVTTVAQPPRTPHRRLLQSRRQLLQSRHPIDVTIDVTLSSLDQDNQRRVLHGYMSAPVQRGTNPNRDTKIPIKPGQTDAQKFDLTTCSQSDVGPSQIPTATNTFTPGQQLTVTWATTIAHPNPPGVRVAVKYADDTFLDHVLATGLQAGAVGGTTTVTLPTKQGRAELMWSWSSTTDQGYYISCADIQIGPAADQGNIVPGGNNNQQGGTNTNTNTGNTNTNTVGAAPAPGTGGDGDAAVIVVCVLIILVAVASVALYARSDAHQPQSHPHVQQQVQASLPRIKSMRPKSVAKGLRADPSGGLPYGWHSTCDAEGDTYYYHDNGSTSWEYPTA
jgi:hypothetical protein